MSLFRGFHDLPSPQNLVGPQIKKMVIDQRGFLKTSRNNDGVDHKVVVLRWLKLDDAW